MIGIYKITNKLDNKVYIGQSDNVLRRIGEHKRQRKVDIDSYINILGVDNFEFEILEECKKEELDKKEQLYIEQYNSIKEGYNLQKGGFNNSSGEGNGRSRITEEDVIKIRIAYDNHESPKSYYEKNYKNKISLSQFQGIWQGTSWSYIMPEVYTEENKNYYTKEMCKKTKNLTPEDVYEYRKYYVNHTKEDVYNKYLLEHNGEETLTLKSFGMILSGDVKPNSNYLLYPVYNKRKQKWSNE